MLETNFKALTEKSNLQTDIIKQRQLLTNYNGATFEILYDYITDICNIGKAVYYGKAKANKYTISKMLKKLHVNHYGSGGNNTLSEV